MNESISPARVQHLEIIQSNIARMSENSHHMKTWCLAIISALLGISTTSGEPILSLLSFVLSLVFWCLDACYLKCERRLIALYNDVISKESTIKLFSMDTSRYTSFQYTFRGAFLKSWSTIAFYIPIAFALAAIVAYGYFGENGQSCCCSCCKVCP